MGPSACVFQGLGQIPMVERGAGRHIMFVKLFAEPAVIGDAFGIYFAAPRWNDPRPGDRKAVAFETKLRHQGYIFRVAVVLIAGDIPVFPGVYRARFAGKRIPDAFTPAAFMRRAFYLISGGSGAP